MFARDGYRCIDCGRRARALPGSLLEADHDRELTDGGTNDPANLVTRCLEHHDAKTQERRMARTQQTPRPGQPQTRARRAAQTAQLPDRPAARPHFAVVISGASLAVGAYAVSMILGRDDSTLIVLAVVALVLVSAGSYAARRARWRRTVEAQRVFERLAKAAGLPNAARKTRFKVAAWKGTTPQSVLVTYSSMFDPDKTSDWEGLRTAFAAAVDADPASVRATRRPRGRALLAVTDEHVARVRDVEPAQPVVESARAPERADVIADRVRDALAGVLGDDCKVTIEAWWGNGEPRAGTITYPSRATRAARDARADLPRVMADAFPPVSDHGLWVFEWTPAQDRFGFSDVPDDLAPVVDMAPIDPDLDLRVGPVLGVTEHGKPWHQPILENHLLVAGTTGAGKGSVLWGVVRALTPLIATGRCLLYVSDPKGGLEFGRIKPIAHRFVLADGTEGMLQEAVEDMAAQARRIAATGERKLDQPTRENPLRVIIVDELANFSTNKEVAALMATLLQQGRAVGVVVVGALQDAKVSAIPNRDLFPSAVALRLRARNMADMVLGGGMRAAGAVCDLIPRNLQGVGYVVTEDSPDPVRVRAAFVPDEEIARLVERDVEPPAHSARATGEQYALEPPPEPRKPRKPRKPRVVRARTEPTRLDPESVIPAREVRARDLLDMDLNGVRARLPEDPDVVILLGCEPDGEDRVELTYRYEGETGERVYSFETSDMVTLL